MYFGDLFIGSSKVVGSCNLVPASDGAAAAGQKCVLNLAGELSELHTHTLHNQ